MGYILGYDPDTLQEIVEVEECERRLEEIGGLRSLPALLERVWLLKATGRLDEALELSAHAVRVARMASTRKDLLRSRILHATVLQARGELIEADQELTFCADEAEGHDWKAVAAFALQHRGRVRYDDGDYVAAREDFKRALFLRQSAGSSDEQLEAALLAVDAADRRRAGAQL